MNVKFHFIRNRKYLFAVSLTIIIIGVIACLVRGVRLDIEFAGGSVIEYSYSGEVKDSDVKDIAEKQLPGKEISVQKTVNFADSSQKMVVSVAGNDALSIDDFSKLTEALNQEFPEQKFEISSSDLVSPSIGREMLMNGLLALLIASVLIIGFVWYSFRKMSGPSAGFMALVALLHDITIASIAFILFGGAINETLIAVILTILGFSINDTIVIYDRIRENMLLSRGSLPLEDVVNNSIKQSLGRSINTSLCMFISVVIAYGFAVAYNLESIKEFALPMMAGIISGTYSSICIASPLWVAWKKRARKK